MDERVGPQAKGERLAWGELPASVRQALEDHFGARVERAATQVGGFSPGVATVPGSSFYSRPELGRDKIRFAFSKRLETLEAAAERLRDL